MSWKPKPAPFSEDIAYAIIAGFAVYMTLVTLIYMHGAKW